MGTNYYWKSSDGRTLHIGKLSVGWAFSLHVIPEENINTLNDWVRLFKKSGSYIEDEYKTEITITEMLAIIQENKSNISYNLIKKSYIDNIALGFSFRSVSEFLDINHAKIDDKYGLLRRKSKNSEEGPWDYCDGEFC